MISVMPRTYFTDYDKALDFLMYGLAKSGNRIFKGEQGLAKTKRFMKEIGDPHANLKTVHIAGTSGKGTVAYMTEAILRQHGFSTGMLISPHTYDIRERFQVNGQLIRKASFLNEINQIMPAIINRFMATESPTYFQVNTALGFSLLKRNKVNYSIIETGLGGLYDSTNVLEQADKVCVITRIGKDHQRILGRSYGAIAAQKAGIIHDGNYVITIPQRKDVNRVIRAHAISAKSELSVENPENYRSLNLNNPQLQAEFQTENIALALAACKHLATRDHWEFLKSKAIKALEELVLPGRFDLLINGEKTYIFDGAHNPQKLSALANQYQLNYKQKASVIMALKSDKHLKDSVAAIAPVAKEFVFTKFLADQDFAAQAHDPQELVEVAKSVGVKARLASSAHESISLVSSEKLVLITGSNYLLGEVRQLLDN